MEVTAPIDEQLCTRLLQAVEEAPDRLQLLVLDETMEEVRRAGAVEVRFESVVQRRPRVGPTLSFSALLLAVPEDSSALKRSLRQVIFWGEDDFASGPLALAEPSLPDEIRALLADGGYLPR